MMESYGATCCYVVDSGGALNMNDVRDRFRAFKEEPTGAIQVGDETLSVSEEGSRQSPQ